MKYIDEKSSYLEVLYAIFGKHPNYVFTGDPNEFRRVISCILTTIPVRNERIVRLRYGLPDGFARSYAEIGRMYNVTGTRIAQINTRALRMLRHPSRSSKLKKFITREI
jgi:DNA-directed RNA polymerase sigma subunit (sigma70/sigma32)